MLLLVASCIKFPYNRTIIIGVFSLKMSIFAPNSKNNNQYENKSLSISEFIAVGFHCGCPCAEL